MAVIVAVAAVVTVFVFVFELLLPVLLCHFAVLSPAAGLQSPPNHSEPSVRAQTRVKAGLLQTETH